MRDRILLYDQEEPIYDHYGVERELERIMGRKVPLKSGGSLVIGEMEALTAIDVNTGKHVGTNLGETIVKANMEAAAEALRQLPAARHGRDHRGRLYRHGERERPQEGARLLYATA